MNLLISAIRRLFRSGSTGESNRFEASMNFDLENVRPFIDQLNENLGLQLNTDALTDFVSSTRVDSERTLQTEAHFEASNVFLEIQVHMDDVDAPDIYFFTDSDALASSIDRELRMFADKLGI